MKKMLSLTLGAALLAAAGTAYAATTDGSTSTGTGTATPPAVSAKPFAKGMDKGIGIYKGITATGNTELLTLLGLDQAGLAQELAAGKSLAAIAQAKGVDKQKVIDLLYNQEVARLDQMVKDGKVTQTFVDQQKTGLAERIASLVELPASGKGGRGGMDAGKGGFGRGGHGVKGGGFGYGADLNEAATILGMTAQELKQELQAGKSLSEIASDKGISEDQLVDSLTVKAKEKIKESVGKKRTAPAVKAPAASAPAASAPAASAPATTSSVSS